MSDDEAESIIEAEVFIVPPGNGDDILSDEDSGQEEEADVNHLSGRQLSSRAIISMKTKLGKFTLGEESDEDVVVAGPSKKVTFVFKPQWKNADLSERNS